MAMKSSTDALAGIQGTGHVVGTLDSDLEALQFHESEHSVNDVHQQHLFPNQIRTSVRYARPARTISLGLTTVAGVSYLGR